MRGSNVKNQRDSYLHGSAAWPTYGVSCPREVIKWRLGVKAGWVYAPFVTFTSLQCLLGREVMRDTFWRVTNRVQRAVAGAAPSPGLQTLECHQFVGLCGCLKELQRPWNMTSFRSF